jgi:hypothetical protein
MKSRMGWSLLAFFLCCCGTHPKEAVDSVRISDSHFASRVSPPTVDRHPEIASIVREIAAVRGWSADLSVGIESAGHDRLVAAMLADARSQTTPEEQAVQSDFLKAFGWVPPDFDFERDVTTPFANELSGLYCFTWHRILLAPHLDSTSIESVLRHELVHAFQDSRYHIGTKVRWATDQADTIAAIHALAEGEAICIARQLADPHRRGCLDLAAEELDHSNVRQGLRLLPPVIIESLVAPYVDGVRYVRRLLRESGWPAVERAWHGELQSTRDLLRESSERPNLLPVAHAALPEGFGKCETRYRDILGEQSIRSVIAETASPSEVETTLASLAGERAAVWHCSKFCATAWHFRFFDPTSALVVADWLRSSLGLNRLGTGGSGPCVSHPRGTATLAVRGHDIAITSVHACHDVPNQKVTESCSKATELANWLISLLN